MRRTLTISIAAFVAITTSPSVARSTADRLRTVNQSLSAGKTDDALAELRSIVAEEPGNGRARHALGSMLNAQGHYPEALRHAEAAVAVEPGNGRYRYGLGVVLAEHGRFAEAVGNFDKALAAHPDLSYGWLERGAAKLALGDGAGAWTDWVRARDSAPSLIWTRWYPASGDFLAGRFAMAAEAFDRVAKAERGFAPAAVWAYLANRRAGTAKNFSYHEVKDWPGPVLDYFAGKLDAGALLSLASEDRKSGDQRRIGEAHFFIGQKALLDGNRGLAAEHFRKAIAVEAPRHVWKIAAERDLARLGP